MTTKRITYTLPPGSVRAGRPIPDGSVFVVIPSPEYVAAFPAAADAMEALKKRPGSVPTNALNVTVCDLADLPPSGLRFLGAWRYIGGRAVVDLPLARAQRMAEIRAERDKRLVASDGQIARAQDIGTPAEVAALKTYRQALRDVPQAIDLGTLPTAEALATFDLVWPMPGRPL